MANCRRLAFKVLGPVSLLLMLCLSAAFASDTTGLPDTETLTQAKCLAGLSTLWLTTGRDGPVCVRYAYSSVGGGGDLAFGVLADAQFIRPTSGGENGPPSAAVLASRAETWSRLFHGPAVVIARPGAIGTSGDRQVAAGSKIEVDRVSAALDALKLRLLVHGFHLAGVGSGGNLVATLAVRRDDVACAVMGGAWLSERDRLAETGEVFEPWKLRATNDPLTAIGPLHDHAGLRMIDLVDPTDAETPDAAITAFADAARIRGALLRRIALPALTSISDRAELTIRAGIGCATGATDAQIDTLIHAPKQLAETQQQANVAPLRPLGDLILPPIGRPGPTPILPQLRASLPPPPPAPVAAPIPAQAPQPQPQANDITSPRDQPDRPPAPIPSPTPVLPQITVSSPPKSDPATFSRADLIDGKSIDEAGCTALPFAVWVTSVGLPECVRYYYSDAGGKSPRALLFLNGDFTYRGPDGQPTVDPDYAHLTPADLQHVADVRSRDYGGPMIYLARPGTLGSSGHELQIRHTPREVAIVAAAVSEIKWRHRIEIFDLIGHSGGGLLVGALVAERSDIGCAVSSSGVLATNAWTSQRLNIPQTNSGFLYDPLEHVHEIRPGPSFRYILLTDAADTTVSATSTKLYRDALDAAGVRYVHMSLTAADDAHHDLALHGFRAAIACAHGMTDADITAVLTKTVVTNRQMSELSPLGDMPDQAVDTDTSAPSSPAHPH